MSLEKRQAQMKDRMEGVRQLAQRKGITMTKAYKRMPALVRRIRYDLKMVEAEAIYL